MGDEHHQKSRLLIPFRPLGNGGTWDSTDDSHKVMSHFFKIFRVRTGPSRVHRIGPLAGLIHGMPTELEYFPNVISAQSRDFVGMEYPS